MPWAYDAALDHQWTILHLEHATYFAAGFLLWWPVVHGQLSTGGKSLYVFGAFVLGSPLGLLLALLPRPVYDFYEHAPNLWGLSDLADQQLAGVTMASEQAVVFFVVLAIFLRRFFEEEGRADGTASRLLVEAVLDHLEVLVLGVRGPENHGIVLGMENVGETDVRAVKPLKAPNNPLGPVPVVPEREGHLVRRETDPERAALGRLGTKIVRRGR